MLPLAVVDGQINAERKKDVLDAGQEGDVHSGAVHLSHDALVGPSAGRVDRVERRDVADVVPVRELDPEGQD